MTFYAVRINLIKFEKRKFILVAIFSLPWPKNFTKGKKAVSKM